MAILDTRRRRQLKEAGWQQARYVGEDGRLVNQADHMATDTATSSRIGRLYRSFWQGQVPGETAYHWIVRPPVGIALLGVTRAHTVFNGRLDITFLVGGSYTSVEYSHDGFNFDETLVDVAQTKLERVGGLTGASARSSNAPAISPTEGPVRAPSAQTAAGAHPRFNNTLFPVFEYSNPGVDPVELWLDITWEEEILD